MRTTSSLFAVVAFSSLLFGCGGGTESADGGGSASSDNDGASEGSDGCPAGTVRIVSKMQHYDPFCAQPCTTTSDCSAGMACVLDIFGIPDPGIPFCVSESVPPPPSGPGGGIQLDGPSTSCVDAMTLGQRYVNQKTGIAGYERIACPQGCEEHRPDDAGNPYSTTARCL